MLSCPLHLLLLDGLGVFMKSADNDFVASDLASPTHGDDAAKPSARKPAAKKAADGEGAQKTAAKKPAARKKADSAAPTPVPPAD